MSTQEKPPREVFEHKEFGGFYHGHGGEPEKYTAFIEYSAYESLRRERDRLNQIHDMDVLIMDGLRRVLATARMALNGSTKPLELALKDYDKNPLPASDERDALRAENSKLQAQLYVAKDSALRTYDGLSERAALADKWRNDLDEAIATLERIVARSHSWVISEATAKIEAPIHESYRNIAEAELAKLRGREGSGG